jgi:hypothetical protein
MWRCPSCSRTFAARGQVHACGELGTIEAHLDGVEPVVRATVHAFIDAVRDLGRVDVLPQRTRIAFHARMSFAVLVPRRRWVNGHLVLARAVSDARFTRVTSYSPRNHVHEFRLVDPDDVDALRPWIAEAFDVGRQRHHRAGSPSDDG